MVRAGESLMKLVSDLKIYLILNDFPNVNEAISSNSNMFKEMQVCWTVVRDSDWIWLQKKIFYFSPLATGTSPLSEMIWQQICSSWRRNIIPALLSKIMFPWIQYYLMYTKLNFVNFQKSFQIQVITKTNGSSVGKQDIINSRTISKTTLFFRSVVAEGLFSAPRRSEEKKYAIVKGGWGSE